MLLGGLQKLTLLDYPGKVACIVFTVGCNFRCPFCHNPDLVLEERIKLQKPLKEEDFFSRLQTRRGLLDGVSICGGEPTVQPGLYNFCKKVKEMGFLVKLDTNGSNASVLERLLEDSLVDYVAVDAKRPLRGNEESVLSYQHLLVNGSNENVFNTFLENYKRCLEILKNSSITYEYRTTVIKGYHTPSIIEQIAKELHGCQKYFLQNYRPVNILNPTFTGMSFTENEMEELCLAARKYVKNTYKRM